MEIHGNPHLLVVEARLQSQVQPGAVTREVVIAAYRLLLGRDPENEEIIEHWVLSSNTVDELRRTILLSKEFVNNSGELILNRRFPCDLSRECKIDVTGTPGQLSVLFRRVSQTWSELGQTDPYWSVLSSEQFRLTQFEISRRQFFESGNADVERMLVWMERNGVSLLPGQTCLEYGCGTARITPYLAPHFQMTHACDISKPHLSLANVAVREAGLEARVAFHLIASPKSVVDLPPVDVIFSVIVLQHNPPPVIAYILDKLLASMRRGGTAYFQVPTFCESYRFDLREYLEAPISSKSTIEMHVLPQRYIFDIISRNCCQVLEVQPDNLVGDMNFVSDTFLVRKI